MVLTLFSALVLSAAAAPPRIAFPTLNGVHLEPAETALQAEVIAQAFADLGVPVISGRDLATILGVERQRQLLGCSEGECIAELTGALGADGILIGDLGRLDGAWVLNLKVLGPNNGQVLARVNERGETSEAVIHRGVRSVVRGLAQAWHRPELVPVEEKAGASKAWAVIPLVAGLAALGAGAGLQVVAENDYQHLKTGVDSEAMAAQLRNDGRTSQTVSNVLLPAGGVLLVTSVVLFFVLPGDAVKPVVAVGPQQTTVGIAGVFP